MLWCSDVNNRVGSAFAMLYQLFCHVLSERRKKFKMPDRCVAVGCNTGQDKQPKDPSISFFRFPLQDKYLLQKWVSALKRADWNPTKWSRICSLHFSEDDIEWIRTDGQVHEVHYIVMNNFAVCTYCKIRENYSPVKSFCVTVPLLKIAPQTICVFSIVLHIDP